MIPAKHFYMVRHGQTDANKERIMAGRVDSPLTDLGRKQARALHQVVLNLEIPPQIVVHSHLSRARDTAHIINEALKLPIIEDESFGEIDAGDWEGVPYDDCPEIIEGHIDPPNGESFESFALRIKTAKSALLNREETPPLIVSHGGVFKVLSKIYGLKAPLIPNCILYEFTPTQGEYAFPWNVWCHEFDEGSQEVIKRPAGGYHSENNFSAQLSG